MHKENINNHLNICAIFNAFFPVRYHYHKINILLTKQAEKQNNKYDL